MIRQAISCDICGSEKKQTNHWFVAYEQAGELRLAGWNSRNRLRAGARHLCGQTCLHKLIDDFMARDMAGRTQTAAAAVAEAEAVAVAEAEKSSRFMALEAEKASRFARDSRDTSLTADVAYAEDFESSARLIPTPATRVIPAAVAKSATLPPPVELVPAARACAVEPVAEETARFSSRNWRAEAWEREREREQHGLPRHSGVAARRRSNG